MSSAVYRLAYELLVQIFVEVRNAAQEHDEQGARYNFRWISVSHVCRTWREVAIDCPKLWSTIYVAGGAPIIWIKEQLLRSKRIPLTVLADSETSLLDQSIQDRRGELEGLVMTESPRIFELRLRADVRKLKLLRMGAPVLQKLVLVNDTRDDNRDDTGVIPNLLFDGETPSLVHLEIHYYPSSWDHSLLSPNLMHLEISARNEYQFDLRGMLAALERMPLLETLGLVLGRKMSFFVVILPARKVSLSHLRYIRLGGRPWACGAVLDYLDFPETATIALVLSDTPRGFRGLVHQIVTCSQRLGPLQALSMDSNEPHSGANDTRLHRLRTWHDVREGALPWAQDGPPPRIDLTLTSPGKFDRLPTRILEIIADEFLGTDVHTLYVSGQCVSSILGWSSIFELFPNVSTLHAVDLYNPHPHFFITDALGVDSLPRLRTLSLGGLNFCLACVDCPTKRFFEDLLWCLKYRRSRIEELDISRCYRGGAWVADEFRKVVGHVSPEYDSKARY
ncbi:hypothetical protein A0H81_14693 [Grifola frondosa]|uniref:F-box domain-containing protein n=1 Tax=Grifola frondosa TaxID=5627 RepID=A0A1C7LR22_GRIFR|nr:hypothetical protein A0H81_14693 [Grifola frondosa]